MDYIFKKKNIYTLNRLAFIFFVLCLQSILWFFLLNYYARQHDLKELTDLTSRISQELIYKNGKWDTSQYAADPQTPHPSGSSGFFTPLYIISSDGFVIERNAPIHGFLDTSDFNHLMTFQKPQTIQIITNEQWRILSKPIESNNKTNGVIVVAQYHPEKYIADVVDSKLTKNLDYLESKTKVKNGEIDTQDVDIRSIDYDVSFEIVNNYNKVLLNNGRMPTFIDKSYVYNELKTNKTVRTLKDTTTQKNYLVVSYVLKDASHNPVGIVITGRSSEFMNDIFTKSAPMIILSILVTTGLIGLFMNMTVTKSVETYEKTKHVKAMPSHIRFDKKTGALTIDTHRIDIAYASNQYYLAKAVFGNPKKRFEVDELLEEFGLDGNLEQWRKVYDAMILLNKKVENVLPVKLVELRDKTYQINPQLVSAISS